ncbi:MAG: hypothetical protein JOZ73_06440, partial [Solirubrobacterales bacterium]|nr:hypothetical protein [Solirubrobacterales bacterium]
MRRAKTATAWLALAAALASAPAGAGAASARLQGEFRMSGKITSALHVPGERRGKKIVRSWVFTPR